MSEDLASQFQSATAEGPFGFKRDRTDPIVHFRGFEAMDPKDKASVLEVRDGKIASCIARLPGQALLIEHVDAGYLMEETGTRWGYTVKRVSVPEEKPEAPPEKPAPVVSQPTMPPRPAPPAPVMPVTPPAPVLVPQPAPVAPAPPTAAPPAEIKLKPPVAPLPEVAARASKPTLSDSQTLPAMTGVGKSPAAVVADAPVRPSAPRSPVRRPVRPEQPPGTPPTTRPQPKAPAPKVTQPETVDTNDLIGAAILGESPSAPQPDPEPEMWRPDTLQPRRTLTAAHHFDGETLRVLAIWFVVALLLAQCLLLLIK